MSDEFPEYHKINSLFKRDERNRFMIGEWSTPELGFLADCPWQWTEKVDGTNIRLLLQMDADGVNWTEYRGRTDNAQFSKPLIDALESIINDSAFQDRAVKTFIGDQGGTGPADVILFGEGYGAGIQKGGAYRDTPGFILFDVLIDGQWWMTPENMRNIGGNLGLDVVPFVGEFSIHDAIELVQSIGFKSEWDGVQPEGLVGVPSAPLFDRRKRRIVTKVKVKDFQ